MRGIDKQTISVILLGGGVITAIAVEPLSALFEPVALQGLFIVICLSMIPFADGSGKGVLSLDRLAWQLVGWQQVALPSIALSIGILADFPEHVTSLMIVTACAGSLFAAPMLAGLLDLDRERALQSMVLSTLCMPASLYLFLSVHHDAHIDLELFGYVQRATIFLGVPLLVLLAYRFLSGYLSGNVARQIETWSNRGAILALLAFGVGIVHPVAVQIHINPMLVFFYLFIVSALSIGMYLLTVIVMYPLGTKGAMTAGILTGFRNIGLSYALIGEMLGSELALYVGVSMLPIFVAPAIIRLTLIASPTAEPSRA